MSGRPPKPRTDYTADAQHLLHLSRAVKADGHRPDAWREDVIDSLKNLADKLINAPALDRHIALPLEGSPK